MMYEEFLAKAKLTEQECPLEQYEQRIERVYMCYERFEGQDEFVAFCKKHGMDGIEALYEPIAKLDERMKRKQALQQCIAEKQAEIDGLAAEARKLALQYGVDLRCL